MFFASVTAHALFFGALVLLGDTPDSAELRRRGEEIAAAFRAGQLDQVMGLWDPAAPSRAADRRRLAILALQASFLLGRIRPRR
jgi:hypothetical protein